MNVTTSNITINGIVGSGGSIAVTIVINMIIFIFLLCCFLICCSRFTLFDLDKKKKLLDKQKEYTEKWSNGDNSATCTIMDAPMIQVTTIDDDDEDERVEEKQKGWTVFNTDNVIFNNAANSRFGKLIQVVIHVTRCLISYRHQLEDREKVTTTFGRDIATYITFQQKMIYATLTCAVIACIMIIPVNVTGMRSQISY
jgi:hypothetical protein